METANKISVSKEAISLELKEKILSTAAAMFKEDGLKFTMQDIAEALRISKKTIYTVYPSKDELLADMIDGLFEDIHRRKAELMASDAPIEDRIESVIIALPEEYAALDFRMLDALEEKHPAAAARVREHLETGWEPTIALLEEGIAQGRIRPVPIPVLRQMITASIESFLVNKTEGINYGDTLLVMIDIIMNGIKNS